MTMYAQQPYIAPHFVPTAMPNTEAYLARNAATLRRVSIITAVMAPVFWHLMWGPQADPYLMLPEFYTWPLAEQVLNIYVYFFLLTCMGARFIGAALAEGGNIALRLLGLFAGLAFLVGVGYGMATGLFDAELPAQKLVNTLAIRSGIELAGLAGVLAVFQALLRTR